jgi:translation initiation factor 5
LVHLYWEVSVTFISYLVAGTCCEPQDEDDGNWAVEVSEEAVRARLQELTDGAKGMTISDDLEKTEKERMDLLYEFIKKKRDACQLMDTNAHKELVTEAERLEIKSKAPLVLAELLFDQNIHTQVCTTAAVGE